ncbi:Na+/Ca+ antiporter, CaCA family [Ferrimonas balearica DSM 9799]|uniref:Na+/Ca+ antiporter, CaCA family n=1 Tax=Ferrimonas balearica (strain DSM 9799 / CCM 4581 / KCTC 23876 / PAT) TaxID=550540 RepID=E1SMC5_FERBD|nr:calcium/sodium antiporter [Ferrimonas balearica]ADN77634.1 Na+/Ca+ antiporter, CaCA family [Ferrimonas balearica DSM 9799]MBY5981707.1 calcium/sodium antiporter [Ferrimonas balearica]
MLLNLLMLLGGLLLLVWSADRFVYGAAALARNLGLPPLIIGLTIVSMGSSAPEAMVATTAALGGYLDTAVGNVVGSNITNITLILGATALLRPMVVGSSTLMKEMPLMLAGTVLAGYLMHDLMLDFSDGVILMGAFILVISGLTWSAWRNRDNVTDPMVAESEAEVPDDVPMGKAVLWLLVGMALLPVASNLMVDGAVYIAKWFGLSDLVIGLTIIAVGTSLPELAACIAGVLKNEDDLAIGNVVGSNLFNILAVLALPALIAGGPINELAAGRDFYVMLGTSLAPLLLLWLKRSRTIGRIEGGLLLICFIAYQVILFTQAG